MNRRTFLRSGVVAGAVSFVAGCSGQQDMQDQQQQQNEQELNWTDLGGDTERAIDRDAGVVLYRWGFNDAGGITAVPITQTDL